MTSDNCIEIALPSDQGYFPGLLVTVYSIVANAAKDRFLSFHILDGGISDNSFALLTEAVSRLSHQCTFQRHKISEQDFSGFPDWKGNKMTYVRFLLPTLIPDKDFVIYADSDCLWYADIADLWAQRENDVSIKGVFDAVGEKREIPWFAKHGIEFPSGKYFCNGLLLLNLRLFRKNSVIERASAFIKQHQDIQFADQSAFNFILVNDSKLLPLHWNHFTREIRNHLVRSPVVLHYANALPWKSKLEKHFVPPYMMLWYQWYAKILNTPLRKVLHAFNVSDVLSYRLYPKVMKNTPLRRMFKIYLLLTGRLGLWPSLCDNLKYTGQIEGAEIS